MRLLVAACRSLRHPREWWQQRDAESSGLKEDLMEPVNFSVYGG